MANDICQSALLTSSAGDIETLVQRYDTILTNILEDHAPLKSCTVTPRPTNPWFSPEIAEAKKLRKRLERRWRRTRLEVDRQNFKAQRASVVNMFNDAKTVFYKDKISSCENQRDLFKIVETLLHNKGRTKLPTRASNSDLSEEFRDYFSSKIRDIREELGALDVSHNVLSASEQSHPDAMPLDMFTPATGDEIQKLISSSPSKSCGIDPIPTWLVKLHHTVLAPVIKEIVNRSLSTAVFPSHFKNALVTPLLKKHNLDPENMKNYRPVSNLTFVSKILERVVASRLHVHLSENLLYEPFQSAYRKYHGTETALLRVKNDILRAIDSKHGVFLVLLDLSAAFDTIDHDILLTRLRNIGVGGTALRWIESYMSGRTQVVNVHGTFSSQADLLYGVPQGSVLGPLFFIIYSRPIAAIAREHGLNVHLYADDTQIYLSFKVGTPFSESSARLSIERCVSDIKLWMTANKLKLNEEKTELLIFTSKYNQSKIQTRRLNIGESIIEPSATARNLGIIFDNTMSMDSHVHKLCQSAYFHIRNINSIRRSLSDESAATIVHALVTSRLDNGNSLLYGISDKSLRRIQCAQNSAARILSRTRKYDHITPILKQLHWLPVRHRIDFKVMLLTWKALNGESPQYLTDLLVPYAPGRSLRSANKNLLSIPRTNTTAGDKSFSVAAPKLWNSLPLHIRSCTSLNIFKNYLKTYLFSIAYS